MFTTATPFVNNYNKKSTQINRCGILISGVLLFSSRYAITSVEEYKLKDIGHNISDARINNVLEVDNMNNIISFNTLHFEDNTVKFKEKFELLFKVEQVGFSYDNDDLDIYCYGETVDELLDMFAENLVVAWKLYVDCDESILSKGAILLKNKLMDLVKVY